MQQQLFTIIRRPVLLELFQFSKSTLQNRINDGLIPPPIPLGGRCVGWLSNEVNYTLKAMCSGATNNEIKNLVSTLVSARSDKETLSF